MPRFDGTGPIGRGPATGRGMGPCVGRPKAPRRLQLNPNVIYFKPRGIPLTELEEVMVEPDELEALKLYELDELDQITSAQKMEISQPTFARILASAHKKVAKAIIFGKAIKIKQP